MGSFQVDLHQSCYHVFSVCSWRRSISRYEYSSECCICHDEIPSADGATGHPVDFLVVPIQFEALETECVLTREHPRISHHLGTDRTFDEVTNLFIENLHTHQMSLVSTPSRQLNVYIYDHPLSCQSRLKIYHGWTWTFPYTTRCKHT